jgi:DNA-binding response OmpR family regulator
MSGQKTVLLIDDDQNLVGLIEKVLKDDGFTVVSTNNGSRGLATLKNVHPDLIILDINMPEMNGLEFYKNIMDYQGKTKFPVLVLTSRTLLEKTFRDIDAAGFLPKPFKIQDLVTEVKRIVSAGG